MRCLSIRQPWAWLICAGKKTIENRVWQTPYRGTIAIHASTTKSDVGRLKKSLETDAFSVNDFQFGAIIGFADIVDIQLYGQEHEEDGFACGPYCFRLEKGRLLKEPVPMNLFTLDSATAAKIEAAETYTVNLNTDSHESRIANAFVFEPDPVQTYRGVIEELDGKIAVNQIFAICNRMIEIDPENGEGYFQRCRAGLVHGLNEKIELDADRLIEMWPDEIEAMVIASEAKVYVGKNEEARQLLERLVQHDPSMPGVRLLYGQALFELEDFEHSIEQFEAALALQLSKEDQEWCHITMAQAFHRINQLEKAKMHIETAKSFGSAIAIIPTIAARIALKSGRLDDARLHVQEALQIDSKYATALEIQDELNALQ